MLVDTLIRFALLNAVILPLPDLVCQNAVLIPYFGSANGLGEKNRITIILTRLVRGGKSFDWVVLQLHAEQPAGE